MVKHKRWSDKPKSDTPSIDEEKNVVEQETSIEKESKDIKSLIVSAATEAACMILRIDDVIATAKSAGPPPGAEGGMPDMGGMGGMPGRGGMGMPPGMGM